MLSDPAGHHEELGQLFSWSMCGEIQSCYLIHPELLVVYPQLTLHKESIDPASSTPGLGLHNRYAIVSKACQATPMDHWM